ncbi:MAG TPA: MBL fold metallo-hydrolase [Planctomycetota bacterium]|nr:MBL fold metallo-hydrolase [Planctomycetota bacterium]
MAKLTKRLDGNVPGEFYVDSSCIDCDLCRQIAPSVFRAEGDNSIVHHQPADVAEAQRAEMALVTCPTASIGTLEKRNLNAAIQSFPEPIEDGVHFCGFASEDSFGGSSYLIVRPGGNVLVDSPRFNAPLVRRIESLGGVKWMFLSHIDDVADHQKFRDHFGCDRIMHAGDAHFDVERVIEGRDPVSIAADLVVIPTPGHTAGSQVLLHQGRFLFTGDHLWWNPEDGRLGASRRYNWHSWTEQRRSMKKLLDHPFEWVLPGHGARHRASAPEMRRQLQDLIARMK